MPPKTAGLSKRGRATKGKAKSTQRSRSPTMTQEHGTDEYGREAPAQPHIDIQEESSDETDASSIASSSAKKVDHLEKKIKLMTDLSEEEEQCMVEWLEAHPIFFDKKMISYKDTKKKDMLWTAKAEEMGKHASVLKTWYKSMRSRYGRIKKKKSGDGDSELTERDEWIARHFDFLCPYIHEVQKKTAVSVSINKL
jgi:hypothetical protein